MKRGGTLLGLIAAGLLIALAALVLARSRTGSESADRAAQPASAPELDTAIGSGARSAPLGAQRSGVDPAAPAAWAGRAARSSGEVGVVLAGTARTRDGPFSGDWSLHLQRVPYPAGRIAETPVVLAQRAPNFEVRDFAPGSYRVWAEGGGLESEAILVELETGAGPVRVELELVEHTVLIGSAIDPSGQPVVGLPVVLVCAGDGTERRARTDALGGFRLAGRTGARGQVFLGGLELSVAAPIDVELEFAVQTLEPSEVPLLGRIDVGVEDALGQPVAGARVEGRVSGAGIAAAESDHDGSASLEHLPAGRYRVFAFHGKRRANRVVELGPGSTASVAIQIRDP